MPVAVAVAAVTAGLGSGAPAPTLGSGSCDTYGQIAFGSGVTPAAGSVLTLTSGASWSGGSVTPMLGLGIAIMPMTAATAALGPFYVAWDSPGRVMTISATNAPAASQPAGTYRVSYTITG